MRQRSLLFTHHRARTRAPSQSLKGCGMPYVTDPVDPVISNTPPRPDGRRGNGSAWRYQNSLRQRVTAYRKVQIVIQIRICLEEMNRYPNVNILARGVNLWTESGPLNSAKGKLYNDVRQLVTASCIERERKEGYETYCQIATVMPRAQRLSLPRRCGPREGPLE